MGQITVDVEITNNDDMVMALNGHLDPAKVRRKTVQGVVDSGATRLVLPAAVAKELVFPSKE